MVTILPPVTAAALRHVGRVLHALRVRRGWTQAQIARATGTDQARIASAEHGKGNPRFLTLDRHAVALGAESFADLVITEGDPMIRELLRAWRALPTSAARHHALEAIWRLVRDAYPAPVPHHHQRHAAHR